MHNKRGQGLSTNAIILIVLGVIILVVLIVGFTMGWNTIAPWIPSGNVDTIVSQCETACVTNSKYDFCTKKRELKADDTLEDINCYYLSQEQTLYGIAECPSISCEQKFVDLVEGETLESTCLENEDLADIVQVLVENKLETC